MIGVWDSAAEGYLYAVAALALAFGLPIFLSPFRWAQTLGWRLPEDRDLALYFGRCLGAIILILAAVNLRGAITGDDLVLTFLLVLGVMAMMVVVHIWGALQRVQPVSETYETGLFAAVFVLGLLFYPG